MWDFVHLLEDLSSFVFEVFFLWHNKVVTLPGWFYLHFEFNSAPPFASGFPDLTFIGL